MTGSRAGLVKVRLIATEERLKEIAEQVVNSLESAGYEVIEWTSPYQCRPPESDKSRMYISAVPK